jgi:hypothetical protein
MRCRACEDEDGQKRQRDNKHVKVSVVSLANAIADPWTMVVKPIHTIVAETAMGSSRWPKDFTGEAVFQLHRLSLDEYLFRSRRRPISGTVERVWHLNLFLYVSSLVLARPRYDTRIAERCPEQRTHGEDK